MNVEHFMSDISKVTHHSTICGEMTFSKCTQIGMAAVITFTCKKCSKAIRVSTHTQEQRDELNNGTVWGAIASGIGHEQTQELLGYMGLHTMSKPVYIKLEETLNEVKFSLAIIF
jgi:hypothetical protein